MKERKDKLGDRTYFVPVVVKTTFFGICIKRETIVITTFAPNRKKAAFSAVAQISGKFDKDKQVAEVLHPLLDVEFVAAMKKTRGAKPEKKKGIFSSLAKLLFRR